MRVSYQWLCELLNEEIGCERLEKIFPTLGMGIESIEKYDDDIVYDLEITPNRPDLLGMIGIARIISAYLGKPFKFDFGEIKEEPKNYLEIEIENYEDCPRYDAIVIENVKVKESSEWLKKRIEKAGIRSLNNVVDISNYVMLLSGHPVHIFDADKVDKIVVRRGKKGENIITLDGTKRDVEDILLICNSKQPIAIAGIMGGEDSGVHLKTNKVIIESAFFNPSLIRKGSKKLNLKTEASFRFERTADVEIVFDVIKITAKLLQEICGGKISSKILDIYNFSRNPKYVEFDGKKINELLGTEFNADDMKKDLILLGFGFENNKIIVPSFRRDIELVEDIAEEIAIIRGYDNIKRSFNVNFSEVVKDKMSDIRHLKYILKGLGLNEAITLSFMEQKFEKRDIQFNYIRNPMWPEKDILRTNLFYGLLNCAKDNIYRGREMITLFEIGNVFIPEQQLHLGILIAGKRTRKWFEQERKFNFYDIKGLFESIMENINIKFDLKDTNNPLFYPQQALDIFIFNEYIGTLGLLKQDIIEEDAYGCEINLEKVLSMKVENKFQKLNKFPPLKRDISLVVPEGLENSKIMDIIINTGSFIENVELIDIYYGKDFKSFTYRIIFRKEDGTMNSKDADEILDRIINELKKVNVNLRRI